MARKSNKTAHVLNLLSGQEAQDMPEGAEPDKIKPEKNEPEKTVPSEPIAPPNISIIDSTVTEADPVSDLIREALEKDLEAEASAEPLTEVQTDSPAELRTDSPAELKTDTPTELKTDAPTELKTDAPTDAPTELQTADSTDAPAEDTFQLVNVMQEIVEDKIIYFMKQFDVCCCSRCRADTIALTLSGLPSRYIVVDKAAVRPLISFYTNRYISQITVEAVKACTQVKENPRHQDSPEI